MPAEEPPAPTTPSPGEVHRQVLRFWDRADLSRALAGGVPGGPEFRFTEGPPTANGRPHMGHLISRALKDTELRFRRMRGYRIVSPMAGWDCHGLPVELEVEKKHGLRSKKEIESFGVERFCQECRSGALEVAGVWQEMSRKLGYWLDYDHAYYTMSPKYIESVWWSLKRLFDQGLLEKGYYVLPYCPRCETPLSSHEVAQGYRETTDPSITVRFKLRGTPGSPERFLLVWTTTPWTLPANLLIAARDDLTYAVVTAPDGSELVLAEAALPRYFPDGATVRERIPGASLRDVPYEPLFPFAGPGERRYRVVTDAMVEASDGTGFVHIAPSFGPEDQRIGAREGVGVFDPLDSRGVFTDRVPPVSGKAFKVADAILLNALRSEGKLFHESTLKHTYPFCWRCSNPLLYRAIDSWFVRTSRRTPKLVQHNAEVRWIPAHLGPGRFGNFLDEAKDWAVSRNRYWGTPLPIWTCPDGHHTAIGSFRELADRSGTTLTEEFDPHRVEVDRIVLSCASCAAPAQREPYTIDGWYDSGSAPFAQFHYPFEPGEFVPDRPLDFVAEGLDQTRGWFYTLLVLSTLLFDRRAYSVCVSNGLVLDETGQKMSKSRGNSVDPLKLLDAEGADAVRWWFYLIDFTEPIKVSEGPIRQAGARTLGTLLHVAEFYRQNALADRLPVARDPPAPKVLLDRWLLSRLDAVVGDATRSLESSDPRPAAQSLRAFVDDLSTWYLRRSRPRFWSETGDDDRRSANDTLSYVLLTTSGLLAPLVPFTSEYLYQTLSGANFERATESVHRTRWPTAIGRADPALDAGMADLRAWVEIGRELRQRAGIKSRIPLASFVIVAPERPKFFALGPEAVRLLEEELNVRHVEQIRADDAMSYPDAEWVRREEGGRVVALLPRRPTAELYREGLRREVMRRLQQLRKELKLAYTDRIELTVYASEEIRTALAAEREAVARELLADDLAIEPEDETTAGLPTWEIEGLTLSARLTRRAPPA